MKREREFYLLRVYLRPQGWWVSVFQVVYFDTGNTWSLLAFGRDPKEGWEFNLLTLEP